MQNNRRTNKPKPGGDQKKETSGQKRGRHERGPQGRKAQRHADAERTENRRSERKAERFTDEGRSEGRRPGGKSGTSPRGDVKKRALAKRSPGKKQPEKKDELVRLNKYIAHAGVCSRREADTLIETGLIEVNGKVATELGMKVHPDDEVKYQGTRIGNERKVYLLLNKPKDYVTTVDDPHAKKTVMDLVGKACKQRIYPVGRLDRNTTGVLLFTNDGDLTRRLTHPSFNKKKIYHVFLDKDLSHSDLNKIAAGIELEDGPVHVDAIAYSHKVYKNQVGLEIHSGRNRVVRRLFQHLGYDVTKLDRVYFAGLTKKDLPRGRYRFLSDREIRMLKTNAFE